MKVKIEKLKVKIFGALFFIVTLFLSAVSAQNVSKVWVADNGDGTYKNPIIHADYSDPDAIRVGDDFYMTASSFSDVPGLPILHSKDLVNWKIINHVFASKNRSKFLPNRNTATEFGLQQFAIKQANFLSFGAIPILGFI